MDNIYLNYKYIFHNYFLLGIFVISYIYYIISSRGNDHIIENIILLSIMIVLIKYNNISINETNEYYYEEENMNKFSERLIKMYEEKAKEVRVDEYFFMNENNILNKKEFKLFFVTKFKNIIEIFWRLEFIRFYNDYVYMKILHFTELFLYIYYHAITMNKGLNCKRCYDNCKIIRLEVEKLMNELNIDLPQHDKTTSNIDKQLYIYKKQLMFIYDSKLLLLSKYSNKINLYDMYVDNELPSNMDGFFMDKTSRKYRRE
jgi:hypothetical protein